MPFGQHNMEYKELHNIRKTGKLIHLSVMVTVLTGILLGGYAGNKLAQFLEVCDLFTPDSVENDV